MSGGGGGQHAWGEVYMFGGATCLGGYMLGGLGLHAWRGGGGGEGGRDYFSST